MTKKCKMCLIKFNDNPYMWCDDCVDFDNAIITRLKQNPPKEFETRLRKSLKKLRNE